MCDRDMKIYQEYQDGDTEPKYQIGDRLSNDDYQILFFEIEHQRLINALAKATGKTPDYLVSFYDSDAIDVINSRSVQDNQDRLKQLKNSFATKVIPFFCHD